MVSVQFQNNDEWRTISFYCYGHADSVEEGNDLICCATSTLVLTLGQNIKDFMSSKQYKKKIDGKIGINNGCAKITVECKDDETYSTLLVIFMAIQSGFRVLAHNYKDNVEVTMFGQEKSLNIPKESLT